MTVAVDIKNLFVFNAGIASFTKNLFEEILAENSIHKFYFLSPKKSDFNFFKSEKSEFIWTKYPPKIKALHLLLYDQYVLPRALKKLKFDVLYSPYYDIPHSYKGSLVSTIHDLSIVYCRDLYPTYYYLYYSKLLSAAVERSKHIVTVSNYSKSEIVNRYNYPEENVSVIYNKVNKYFNNYYPDILLNEYIKRIYNLPQNYLLYTGGYDNRKNVPMLLNAYSLLQNQIKDVPPLVLTGRCSDIQKLSSNINLLRNSVIFPGFIKSEHLPYVYANSLFSIYPSAYEGFGIPLLESLTMGKPVICSDIKVFKEIGEDTCIYFNLKRRNDLADKMKYMLTEFSDCETESKCKKQSSKFMKYNNGKKFLEILSAQGFN